MYNARDSLASGEGEGEERREGEEEEDDLRSTLHTREREYGHDVKANEGAPCVTFESVPRLLLNVNASRRDS